MNCLLELSANAKDYALRQLLRRAGEDSGIPVLYQLPAEKISSPRIYIIPCESSAWNEILQKKIERIPASQTVPTGSVLPFDNDIPILFRGAGFETQTKFAKQREDGAVIFYVDILAAAFFMLTRWEETVTEERDVHGRFTAAQSVAYKQGFLEIPVIDQYALILRQWMKLLAPNWLPASDKPALYLTHDIDFIHQYSNPLEFIRTCGIVLVSHKSLKKLWREFEHLYQQIFTPAQEARLKAVYELAELSAQRGFTSHFYFMAAKRSQYQQGYNPALPQLKSLYQFLSAHGHEIGFHPGYATFKNLEVLQAEKASLERASGLDITSGRQHFLRFEVPRTWRDWEEAGLQNDSTLGYADHEGFRCGTCRPFHPFDIEQDREMNLLEVPLIVMDTTLVYYRKLLPSDALTRINLMAARCFEVGGAFTFLWHNTTSLNEGGVWKPIYTRALDQLGDMLATYSR